MEVKKDVDVLIKEVAACNTLTAEEDFRSDEGCTGQRYRL